MKAFSRSRGWTPFHGPLSYLASWALVLAATAANTASAGDAQSIFDQRIMPIFRSEKPSSCVQCHLASVDLKEYILPSAERTFVSLRDQGLIDLDHPRQSKILQLIQMGERDPDPGAKLIHAKMRQAEYEAFAAWIEACAKDERLRDLPPLSPSERAGPKVANEVIRHARKSRVVESFARTVWSQRMRCFPCHTPFEIDPQNPRQAAALKTRRHIAEQFGKEELERIGFFRRTPEETLQYLIQRSRDRRQGELPIINIEQPGESLLILKPLAKLPPKKADGRFSPASNRIPVTHGGGLKMHLNDPSYKAFTAWLIDYANVVQGKYRSVDDLPEDNWQSTEYVLRVTQLPVKWPPGSVVQLKLYRWDGANNAYETSPFAFTQSVVTPRHMVNGTLFVLTSPARASQDATPREVNLGRGRFLVKVYVDQSGKLERDPTMLLGDDDQVGTLTLEVRRWRPGFKNAQSLSAAQLSTSPDAIGAGGR